MIFCYIYIYIYIDIFHHLILYTYFFDLYDYVLYILIIIISIFNYIFYLPMHQKISVSTIANDDLPRVQIMNDLYYVCGSY